MDCRLSSHIHASGSEPGEVFAEPGFNGDWTDTAIGAVLPMARPVSFPVSQDKRLGWAIEKMEEEMTEPDNYRGLCWRFKQVLLKFPIWPGWDSPFVSVNDVFFQVLQEKDERTLFVMPSACCFLLFRESIVCVLCVLHFFLDKDRKKSYNCRKSKRNEGKKDVLLDKRELPVGGRQCRHTG